MSEKQPYEEMINRQLNDLPLPDQEESWQKMKLMLERDDNDRIVPPLFLRSCAIWGTALLLVAALWFMSRPEKRLGNKAISKTESIKQPPSDKKTQPDDRTTTRAQTSKEKQMVDHSGHTNYPSPDISTNSLDHSNTLLATDLKKQEVAGKQKAVISSANHSTRQTAPQANKSRDKHSITQTDILPTRLPVPTKEQPLIKDPAPKTETKLQAETISTTIDSPKTTVDRSQQEQKKIDPAKKRKLFLLAGVGLQQDIAINGQKTVPYAYNGRKTSFPDYIPSVFLRLQKEDKWFLSAEFRYGAPQPVKEFAYSRHTSVDASFSNLSVTSFKLKKTYYHQLPVSFNYFIKQNWSVGTGAIYSWFHGAIIEKDISNKNLSSQQQTLSTSILRIPKFNDSFLYKTKLHLLVQTEYQWRKLSLALRYSRDLQPYITYTKPTGELLSERNQALEFILRFRLWQRK